MTTTTCLDNETLVRLLLGKIRGPEREALEHHLETCKMCAENAETLAVDDELTAIIKSDNASQIGAAAFTDDDESAVNKLIQRIKSARQQSETVQVEETLAAPNGDMPQSLPAAMGGLSANDTSFLAPPQLPDEVGRLGDYRVLEVLGVGGMGMVFRAEDLRLKRQVALKTMKPTIAASRDSKGRFLREAQATAALEHDNVVPIYAVGEDRGIPFIAMQYLKGESLKDRIDRDTKLSPLMVVRLGKEIASGLSAAHEQGLIHRDIKPDNIWLDEKSDRAKILDFGLVSATSEDEGFTQSGTVLGTPRYMAPEQALAQPVDHRCDLFSLGSVLYHAASGKTPFAGSNFTATLIAVAHQPAVPLQIAAPELHEDVAKAIMQLLEKDPKKRPQSAISVEERFAELERLLNRLSAKGSADEALSDKATYHHVPAGALAPPRKPPTSRKLLLAGAGGLAALMLGVLVITIRDKDGKETIVRVPTGTDVEVDPAPGSKVTIREENPATNEQPTAEAEATSAAAEVRVAKDNSPSKRNLETSAPPVVAAGAKSPLAFKTHEFDQWVKEVSALPAEQQVEAVSTKLVELNPGFDGNVTHEISAGKVTKLTFLSDTVADISPIRALAGLRSFACPGSQSGRSELADLAPLKELSLTELTIHFTKVTDLGPLQGMKLTKLLCALAPITDLSPLNGMPLTHLGVEWTRVSDLSPLRGMPLTVLRVGGTNVTDLTPLHGMPLTGLDLYKTPITDLSPLQGMDLTWLNLSDSRVSDLSLLKDMPLQRIELDFRPNWDTALLRSIRTLETINETPAVEFCDKVEVYNAEARRPLAFQAPGFEEWIKATVALSAEEQVQAVVKKLQELNPEFDGKVTDGWEQAPPLIENGMVRSFGFITNSVTDVSPLRALQNLSILNLHGTDGHGKLLNLAPLKGLPLTELLFYSNQVSDLSPLQGMKLTLLQCSATFVSDLSPLKGMPLKTINFSGTKVTDLSPLTDMPLQSVRCATTSVSDLSPLKGMKLSDFWGGNDLIANYSVLKDMPLHEIQLSFDPERDTELLRSIKTLETINGKPVAEFWKEVEAGAK